MTITDTLRRRGQDLAEVIAGADIVVTSYTLFRLDEEAYARVAWSGLILDEAQFVKNHQAKIHQCARRLPAPFKLAITGTPMENNLMELWSMLSITAPGLFPSPTRFREHYARPDRAAARRRAAGPAAPPDPAAGLRRTKEQVAADLPPKQEQVLDVELEPRHRRSTSGTCSASGRRCSGCSTTWTATGSRSSARSRCCAAQPAPRARRRRRTEHLGCSKIDALIEQLGDVVAGGHRALVFSQFTGFLAQVRARLDAAGIAYAYLDGRPATGPRSSSGSGTARRRCSSSA